METSTTHQAAEEARAADRLSTLYRVACGVTFDKATAAKFVGGRCRLETLIAEKKIRAVKTGTTRLSPYAVNACDVLLYARDRKEQRV